MVVEEPIGPLHPAVEAVLRAIDQLRQRPRSHREPDALTAELRALRRGQDLLELEFAATAAQFSRTEEYEEQGSVSPIDWIRHHCKMSSSAVWNSVAVGEHLAELPRSVEAVESGEIGYAHLTLMARTAEALQGSSTAAPFEETELLEKAREFSVGRLWHFCHHLRHALDPEGFTAEQKRATEERSLKLSPCEDGTLLLEGWLDSVGGAALRSALEPLALPHGDHDERGREHRNADALVEIMTHVQDTGSLPQRPHLQVTASLDTLRGLAGSPGGDMEYSLPVSAETVQRLACDGTITRVVLAPESVVIDVGRARRVVAGATRRALSARDGHCRWPHCDRPASWSDAHHVIHWSKGGETDLSNMVLLCHRHHWMAHEGGWQLVQTAEGEVLTVPPRPPGLARAADVDDPVEAARRFAQQLSSPITPPRLAGPALSPPPPLAGQPLSSPPAFSGQALSSPSPLAGEGRVGAPSEAAPRTGADRRVANEPVDEGAGTKVLGDQTDSNLADRPVEHFTQQLTPARAP